MRVSARASLALVVSVGLAMAGPAGAYPRPGRLELVSVSGAGVPANAMTVATSVSADGRFVAMQSPATTLVPGHGGDRLTEIFVRDRVAGVTEPITVAEDASAPDQSSFGGSLTPDGRFVAFTSRATNLAPTDTTDLPWDGREQIYLRDRIAGVTERVSVSSDEEDGNGNSRVSSMTPDARYVAFASDATNLVDGDTNETRDVFVRDRLLGTTERISLSVDGDQADGWSETPSISADGSIVAFESLATNLVPTETGADDTNIYVRDLSRNTTELLSVSSAGETANRYSGNPMVSANGRFVAFWSMASNLVPGDQAECDWPDFGAIPVSVNCTDVFVHDRQTRTTERVSVTSAGGESNGESYPSWISGDGRWVGFESYGTSLAGNPPDVYQSDAYLHDRRTGVTERLSVTDEGDSAKGYSGGPVASQDLRFVAFSTGASNLHASAASGKFQGVLRDRGPDLGIGEMRASPVGGRIEVSGWGSVGARVLTDRVDPPADALPGASEVGAELLGARISLRPEQEDLLVRLDAARIPAVHPERPVNGLTVLPGTTAAPAVVWGASFEVDGTRYEVRAAREAAASFALYRCAEVCTEESTLSGGIGTLGEAVVVSVPLEALGLEKTAQLTAARAFSGVGALETGPVVEMDRVELASSPLPLSRIELGVAPAGTPEHEVNFATTGELSQGRFLGFIDDADTVSGSRDVWARICLGQQCGSGVTTIGRE